MGGKVGLSFLGLAALLALAAPAPLAAETNGQKTIEVAAGVNGAGLVNGAINGALNGTANGYAAPVHVSGVRFGEHRGQTRFVLDLSQRVAERIFTLATPYRVVIDLPAVTWQVARDGTYSGFGLIDSFRYGRFKPGTSRLVLDTKRPVVVQDAFWLAPNQDSPYHRLVLDLAGISEEAFVANQIVPAAAPAATPAAVVLPPAAPATPVCQMPPRSDGKRVVVIDPGHGGIDPGATSVGGHHEKDIVLRVAKRLRKELEDTGHYKVVLTREKDEFIPLRERIAIAREAGAELFLSVHADSLRHKKMRGASVYTLSQKASDKETEELAARENKADIIAGADLSGQADDVQHILIDLCQDATKTHSLQFAGYVVDEIKNVAMTLRKPRRSAGFAVLKAPDVPSILIEVGYLSNLRDEKLLRSQWHQAKLAGALREAIDAYFAWSSTHSGL
jgi:N-acetylmuramoyl-L-alanine amidase